MSDLPKYSRLEIERRWLVDVAVIAELDRCPSREIDDLYLAGSRLRLRRMSGPAAGITFKLCKKYGKRTSLIEPVTNLYLTESEYLALAALPGYRARKRRYSVANGALDLYLEPNTGLAVFEINFDDEDSANSYRPPVFVTREITGDSAFSGISLAQSCATA